MKFFKYMMTSCLAFILLGTQAYASTHHCTMLKESQLQYVNQINARGQYAFFSLKDIAAQETFTLNIDEAKNTAILAFAHQDKSRENPPVNLTLVSKDADQVSFSGLFNQNPILLTFYIQNKSSIYSIHWLDNKDTKNIHMNIGYGQCD